MDDRVVLVMGVAGSGKTTLGRALAARLGVAFLDADDLHPAANRAKMAAGVALEDADRRPWLEAVAGVIGDWRAAGQGGVVACSALKRAYRERLRGADAGLVTVWLDVEAAVLAERLAARRGHFFPPSLLASQLAALEPPGEDESPAVRVDGRLGLDAAVDAVAGALGGAVS